MKIKRRGKMISAARVRSLLSSQTSSLDSELQPRVPGQPHRLEDGQLLLVLEDGRGTLYPSRAALIELLNQVESLAKQGPVDPKKSLLPPTDMFIARVQEQAAHLAQLLGSPELLDGSEASLKVVDEALRTLPSDLRMSPEWVSSLVAYVGEILRTATNGRWEQFHPSPEEVEPAIVARDGRRLQPFALVYGELCRGRQGSLQGATHGVLHAFRLGGLTSKNQS